MTEHFTRSTVSAAFHCGKCGRATQHRVDDGRKGPCLECIARLDADYAARKPKEENKQGELALQRREDFGKNGDATTPGFFK